MKLSIRKIVKSIITFAGLIFILVGIPLLIFPGPGFLFIAVGIAILATEFSWARNLLKKNKNKTKPSESIDYYRRR